MSTAIIDAKLYAPINVKPAEGEAGQGAGF